MMNTYQTPETHIEILYQTPPALAVTGAAAQSMRAADQAAALTIQTLHTTADRLSSWLASHPTTDDATTMAGGLRLLASYDAALADIIDLAPRHRKALTVADRAYWPGGRCSPAQAAARRAAELRQRLTDAGIPMPDGGELTVAYWHDAAARGC